MLLCLFQLIVRFACILVLCNLEHISTNIEIFIQQLAQNCFRGVVENILYSQKNWQILKRLYSLLSKKGVGDCNLLQSRYAKTISSFVLKMVQRYQVLWIQMWIYVMSYRDKYITVRQRYRENLEVPKYDYHILYSCHPVLALQFGSIFLSPIDILLRRLPYFYTLDIYFLFALCSSEWCVDTKKLDVDNGNFMVKTAAW